MMNALPNPIFSLVTVIITTSPTPSAPSTDLLEAVTTSFRRHCPDLLTCRVIVIFDTYDQVVARARLKKGQVTAEVAQNYGLYVKNAKQLIQSTFLSGDTSSEVAFDEECHEAEFGSPFMEEASVAFTVKQSRDGRVSFIEPSRRLGFGLAVRSALRQVVTPYVWIQQHDWALAADIPIMSLVDVMSTHGTDVEAAPVKYIGLSSVRVLEYARCQQLEVFRELTASLKRDFYPTVPTSPQCPSSADDDKKRKAVPLTPLFFWFDKPHVASTSHYLRRVFPSRLAMQRGEFIEDKIGNRARDQMKAGNWVKWACWLYYPDEGRRQCLQHLQGRTWRGIEKQEEVNKMWKERNLAALALVKARSTDMP